MILRKKFWLRFIGYVMVVTFIHFVLFLFLGGVGLADDISNETRMSYATIPIFLINKIFGFPINLFIQYDPINESSIDIWLILIYILNCLIQFYILSFLWNFTRRQ